MTTENENLMTIEQVAARLSVHPESARRYIKRGVMGVKLHAIKLGKEYRVDPEDLRRFLAQLSRAA